MLPASSNPCKDVLSPPSIVKDMKQLDKSAFVKDVDVPYIQIDTPSVSKVMPVVKPYLVKLDRFKAVQQDADAAISSILLDPNKITSYDDFNDSCRDTLRLYNITYLSHKKLQLTFDNYSTEDIFRAILPANQEGISSFTKVGHIVQVNLRDHLLPYKAVIGEVLLAKVAACRTVVNKIDPIENTFRFFKMDVLAGDEEFRVRLKENRCIFEFDFATVYWNSRLSTEHERITNLIQRDQVLFDVFAGIGPFAIPSAKRGVRVWANDLNPESVKWLKRNAQLNKVGDNLQCFNMDAALFIQNVIRRELLGYVKQNKVVHIVMNLPSLASEFLKFYKNLYTSDDLREVKTWLAPIVYLYCFAKGEDTEPLARRCIDCAMNRDMSTFITDIFRVRTVSNNKDMFRVTIRLERALLSNDVDGPDADAANGVQPAKKCTFYLSFARNRVRVPLFLLQADMGKKDRRLSKAFKVIVKSRKSVPKPKPVKTKLKDLNLRKKVEAIDKQLVVIQHKVHKREEVKDDVMAPKPSTQRVPPPPPSNNNQLKIDTQVLLQQMSNVQMM